MVKKIECKIEPVILLKEILPPFLVRWGNKYFEKFYGFYGDYPNWEAALAASHGYGTPQILTRIKDSALRVKNGEAAYEQDGVLHAQHSFHWPILAGLLRIAALKGNHLTVLDYGGSLGSAYFQNRPFLSSLSLLKWLIIEQDSFVEWGRKNIQDDNLKFFNNLKDCFKKEIADVVLISGVLQYLEKPYQILSEILAHDISYIIIDRHPLISLTKEDRLTVQRVRPSIYKASYPAWFFSEEKFMAFIKPHLTIFASYDCPFRSPIKAKFRGFILEKNHETIQK